MSTNPFYKYDIVAKTGDAGIQKIEFRTSINDLGKVALIGDLNTSAFGGNAVFVGDGSSLIINISGTPSNNQNFGTAVQINNSNQVIASWTNTNSTSAVNLYNGNGGNSFQKIATGGGNQPGFSYPFDYYSILPIVSVNNQGKSTFVGFDENFVFDIFGPRHELGDRKLFTASAPPSPSFKEKVLTSSSLVQPLIADNGDVIISEAINGVRKLILYNNGLGSPQIIAGPSNGFNQIGRSPGISDDGQIVVFAGNKGIGNGIFASVDTGTKREVITIAGENENGLGGIKPKPELGYGDNVPNLQDFLRYFNSFDIDSRVGVSHVETGRAGILDDTFVVSFIGTPNQASRNNLITGKPLLFSDRKGLWTVKVTVDSALAGGAGFDFNKTSAIPVVQVGDVINGATVNDISVYDPIANVGLTNPAPDSHQIAFVANTSAGEMVIKSTHLDTDGDGLLDDWEDNGIDIDRDGVIDLNLKAMGADKNKKDLFLEIDWLAPDGKRDFSPDPAAPDFIVDVFKNKGITLHIDAGKKSGLSRGMGTGSLEGGDVIGEKLGVHYDLVYFDADFPGGPPPGFDFNGDGVANYRSFQDIKDNFFGKTNKRARELAFRYAVFADRSDIEGSSGRAEIQEIDPVSGDFRSISGNDLIVSLQGSRNVTNFVGSFPGGVAIPAGFLQGQTLLHELGHTLGLRHGGADNTTTQPAILPFILNGSHDPVIAALKNSYKSVMNYLYQLYPDLSVASPPLVPPLIRDYSNGSSFDDWNNIKLGFADNFTTVGNSYGIYSLAGVTGTPIDEEELTIDDIKQILGSSALDDRVPIISALTAPTQVNVGNALTVAVTATDNIGVNSVNVSFDVNGNGAVNDPGETVTATLVGVNQYQATLTNITGLAGTRTVTATVTDLAKFTTTATANVTVAASSGNTSPLATNDTTITNEDTPININVLANDSDADGDPLTLSLATLPTNGTATLNNNGTPNNPSDDFIAYNPNINFNGTDSFTYQVNDGKGGTSTANVTVNVTPVDDAPIVANQIANVSVNEDANNTIIDLTNVFSDIDDAVITKTVFANNNPTLVTTNLNNNTLTLDYQPNQFGNASITIQGTSNGKNVISSFTVAVASVNDAPVATDDTATTNRNTPVTLLATTLLANDSDLEANTLSILSVGNATNGSVQLNNNGNVLFTPATDFSGQASFDYTLSDGNNATDSARVTVTVRSIIVGTDSNDTLNGTAADDLIDGKLGDDRMSGSTGNDRYIVNSIRDVVVETANQGIDTVESSVNHTLGNNVENLTLTGNSHISGTGNALNNVITGNNGNNLLKGLAGNDTLQGADGSDTLVGGAGDDLLTGGTGADRFLFGSGAAFTTTALGVDAITDLIGNTDKIALSKATFTALTSVVNSALQANEFVTINTDLGSQLSVAGNSSAKIVYNALSGDLFYNQNGAGVGLGTGGLFANLNNKPSLVVNDLFVQA